MQSDVNQAKTFLSDEEMCRKCSTPWCDTGYSLSIAPIKMTKRKAHKVHKQIEEKSNRKSHLARKLSKRVNNIVVWNLLYSFSIQNIGKNSIR